MSKQVSSLLPWHFPASLCRHLHLSGPASSLPTLAERAIFTYLWVGLVSSWSRKPVFLQCTLRWEGAKTNVMEMAQSYGQGEEGIEWLLATARCGLDSYHQPTTLLSLVYPLLLLPSVFCSASLGKCAPVGGTWRRIFFSEFYNQSASLTAPFLISWLVLRWSQNFLLTSAYMNICTYKLINEPMGTQQLRCWNDLDLYRTLQTIDRNQIYRVLRDME